MSQHGFFIPELDKVVDKEGMLRYLNDKVYQDSECLQCQTKFNNFISS